MRSGSPAATAVGACVSGGCVRRRVRRAGWRAGGLRGRRARGSTQPSRRSAPCYVLCGRAARIRSLATSTEDVGKLLGFSQSARHRLRRAGLWRSREPGSLEPGAMEQRALRTQSPLLLRRERVVVGRGHSCGQRTREMRWRRGCPDSWVNCLRLRRFLYFFFT